MRGRRGGKRVLSSKAGGQNDGWGYDKNKVGYFIIYLLILCERYGQASYRLVW